MHIMSGLEALGIAASIIQVADLGTKLSVRLFSFYRRYKNADQSIQNLSSDVALTCAILRELGENVQKDEQAQLCSKEAFRTLEIILGQAQDVLHQIQDMTSYSDHPRKSSLQQVTRKLRTVLLEPSLNPLKGNLERLKSTMVLLLNVIMYAGQIRNKNDTTLLQEQRGVIEILLQERRNDHQGPRQSTSMKDPEVAPEFVNRQSGHWKEMNFTKSHEPDELEEYNLLMQRMLEDIDCCKTRLENSRHSRIKNGVLNIHGGEIVRFQLERGHPILQSFDHSLFTEQTTNDVTSKCSLDYHPPSFRPENPVSSTVERLDTGKDEKYQSNSDSKNERERSNANSAFGPYRISRAKKGKRVHACGYPGCHLVFIRAERRRRHELSHHGNEQYHCSILGCRKAFHHPDQLAQHEARHTADSPIELRVPSPQQSAPQARDYDLSATVPVDHNALACRADIIPVPKSDDCQEPNDLQATVKIVRNMQSECDNKDNQFDSPPGTLGVVPRKELKPEPVAAGTWPRSLPVTNPSGKVPEHLPSVKEESKRGHRCTQQNTPALDSVTSQPPSVPLATVDGNDSMCVLSPATSRTPEKEVMNLPLKRHNGHRAGILNLMSRDQISSTIGQDAYVKTCHLSRLQDGARDTRRVDYPSPNPTYVDRNFLPDSFVNLMLHWTNLAENEIYVL